GSRGRSPTGTGSTPGRGSARSSKNNPESARHCSPGGGIESRSHPEVSPMPVDPARAKSLVLAASELANPAERAAYLKRECGGDADLRARVEARLRANYASPLPEPGVADATAAFVPEEPATARCGADASAPTSDYPGKDEQAGAVIGGKYTLVEPIGEGGMGAGWRGGQSGPGRGDVAGEVVKPGVGRPQGVAAFEAGRARRGGGGAPQDPQ